MPNLDEKRQLVQEVKEKMMSSKSTILVDYRGLTVAEANELRTMLRRSGVEYRVVKNTLTTFAAREMDRPELEQYLVGPTALAFGINDPVIPAKLLSEYARTHRNLKLKAGLVEGRVVDLAGVRALAELPPREVLLSQVLGTVRAPIANWVGVLQAPLRQLLYVLDRVRELKEGPKTEAS
ncbi:MAG: 50S ribosomal protein L10 [Syntrophomonadaceae bacterium]|nr:50S ribosomal protein L10 [Syntrophomonadaceae bacterium]